MYKIIKKSYNHITQIAYALRDGKKVRLWGTYAFGGLSWYDTTNETWVASNEWEWLYN